MTSSVGFYPLNFMLTYLKHGVENIIFDKRIGFNKKEGTSFSTGYFCWKLLNKEKIHVRLEKGNGE